MYEINSLSAWRKPLTVILSKITQSFNENSVWSGTLTLQLLKTDQLVKLSNNYTVMAVMRSVGIVSKIETSDKRLYQLYDDYTDKKKGLSK